MKMHRTIKRALALLLALWTVLMAGCTPALTEKETAPVTEESVAPVSPDPDGASASEPVEGLGINGWALQEFTIVYSKAEPDYTARAAHWLRDAIREQTGVELRLLTVEEQKEPLAHEIVVGETDREISRALTVKDQGLDCAFLARKGHVALEGEAFAIAAAAYRFVQDYIGGTVPWEITVAPPITSAPRHFMLLIGDGMGRSQTRLFEAFRDTAVGSFGDGEANFYGTLFPYQGLCGTDNIGGTTTDSAASATALATGYKTQNGRIGRNVEDQDLLSLTELAASLGMATAVMSTEGSEGATPAAFSAHASDRSDYDEILASQTVLREACGTRIVCGFDGYEKKDVAELEQAVTESLQALFADPDGSFLMFEEAYIDKHCHDNDLTMAYRAMVRFDQVIGLVMEQAFYHPDTLVIITADHETGSLVNRGGGKFSFASDSHTNAKVPVFAYGQGTEVFHQKTVENVQISKTLARLFGGTLAADTDGEYPPL